MQLNNIQLSPFSTYQKKPESKSSTNMPFPLPIHKRRNEEVQPLSNKKLRLDPEGISSIISFIKTNVDSIMVIQKKYHESESLEALKTAAQFQSPLKKLLLKELEKIETVNMDATQKVACLRNILLATGHFLVDDMIKQQDAEILFKLMILLEKIPSEEAQTLASEIERVHSPFLAFHRALFFYLEADQKIKGLLLDEETDWLRILLILEEGRSRFSRSHEIYSELGDIQIQEICSQHITRLSASIAEILEKYSHSLEGDKKEYALLKLMEFHENPCKEGWIHEWVSFIGFREPETQTESTSESDLMLLDENPFA